MNCETCIYRPIGMDKCDYYKECQVDQTFIKPITCLGCGEQIGYVINDHLLIMGELALTEVHGVCAICGHGFHFTVTERQLQKLINKCVNQNGMEK